MSRHKQRDDRVRELIAQEAARIMCEQMVRDFQQAKQKACERLGFSGRVALPGNDEIQAALAAYIGIFRQDSQPALLQKLRQAALQAMRFLKDFEPRLVGTVLEGTADQYSQVQLHVFADHEEQVLQFLIGHGVPYELGSRRLHYRNEREATISICRFVADDVPIELFLFAPVDLREAPCSAVDGKPMTRVNEAQLEQLLDSNQAF